VSAYYLEFYSENWTSGMTVFKNSHASKYLRDEDGISVSENHFF
jgi:hypothetical protein